MRWRRRPLQAPTGCADRRRRGRSLGFDSQRRFGERVELLDRGARHAEDLAATAPEGDPGFERGNALGAQTLDERQRQFGG